jgi:hypothetical protein
MLSRVPFSRRYVGLPRPNRRDGGFVWHSLREPRRIRRTTHGVSLRDPSRISEPSFDCRSVKLPRHTSATGPGFGPGGVYGRRPGQVPRDVCSTARCLVRRTIARHLPRRAPKHEEQRGERRVRRQAFRATTVPEAFSQTWKSSPPSETSAFDYAHILVEKRKPAFSTEMPHAFVQWFMLRILELSLARGRGRELESRFQFEDQNAHEEENEAKRAG